MARDGWIKIWHKLADDPMWLEEPFTRGQAWVDLILIACIGDDDRQPGQVCCSYSYLSRRWRWSRKKVANYLRRLETDGKVELHKKGHQKGQAWGHLLTIVKYRRYQIWEQEKAQAKAPVLAHKEEDTSARSANAGGCGAVGVVPGPFREFFATWEEYDEWRRTNS